MCRSRSCVKPKLACRKISNFFLTSARCVSSRGACARFGVLEPIIHMAHPFRRAHAAHVRGTARCRPDSVSLSSRTPQAPVLFRRYVLAFTSSSAHALATPELGVLPPRGVAQPPSSTNCRCLHESIFRNSACFVAALGCCMKLAKQEGVSATTTAELARSTATRSAVLPRTHPIHEKPTIMVATPPPITPQTAGFSQGACSCMRALLILGAGIFCAGLYEAGGLPASSACGSAEAPRAPPPTATGTAGRGLLHAELAAVEVLAVELRNRLIGLFRRGHLHETEAA